jgi:hypothetical protein
VRPVSFGDWFPDQFGYVDHQIGAVLVRILRRADLSRTHAHRVIEAAVSVVVTEVKGTADDLSTPGRVAVSIAVPLDQDGGAVIRQCPARSSVPPNPSTSRTR